MNPNPEVMTNFLDHIQKSVIVFGAIVLGVIILGGFYISNPGITDGLFDIFF